MLKVLSKIVGGNVKVERSGKWVLWVENDIDRIKKIITNIQDVYPVLTSRKRCQLLFLKKFIYNTKDIDGYFYERENKYLNQPTIINEQSKEPRPYYFGAWLSGFIEAEGCFSIRANSNHSFSIGQNNDKFLLENIKRYFGIESGVLLRSNTVFYNLETYRKSTFVTINNHFNKYPQLGEKLISYRRFLNYTKL